MPLAYVHYIVGDIIVGITEESEKVYDYTNRKIISSTRYGCYDCGEMWGAVRRILPEKDLEVYRHVYDFYPRLCKDCGGGSFFNYHSHSELAHILVAPTTVIYRELEIEFNDK